MTAREKLELAAIWAPIATVVFIALISIGNIFNRD